MPHSYFTLLIRQGGQWAPEFGSYDRGDVYYERDALINGEISRDPKPLRRDTKIIETASDQASINAAVDRLNARGR